MASAQDRGGLSGRIGTTCWGLARVIASYLHFVNKEHAQHPHNVQLGAEAKR